MRVLIVGQYFPPEPVKVGDLALGLRELGHEVAVLTGFPNYPYGRIYKGYRIRLFQCETRDGIHVLRVPLYPDHSYSKFLRFLNYASFAVSGSLLGPFLVDKFDRIIVFQTSPVTMGAPAIVLRRIRGGRLLFWVQDIWPETLEASGVILSPTLMRAIRWVVKTIYRNCDLMLVQSPGFVEKIHDYGVPLNRIFYLPNWAEDIYDIVPYDDEFAAAEGVGQGFTVVFAGTIGVAQNFEVVLQAAGFLQAATDVRFVIVGDGAMYDRSVSLAKQLGLRNVTFKGRRPAEQMPKFFAAADALLVTLRKNPVFAITVPTKLQSYMACGRPIIAALDGVGAEIVRESGGGVVCPPGDPEALRDAVLRLRAMSKQEREMMGMKARRYYEANFARRLVLSKLNELLTSESTDLEGSHP